MSLLRSLAWNKCGFEVLIEMDKVQEVSLSARSQTAGDSGLEEPQTRSTHTHAAGVYILSPYWSSSLIRHVLSQEIDHVIARPSTAPAPTAAADVSLDAAAAAAAEERERVREQIRVWRQQRDEKSAVEAQKRAEAAAAERPKTAPVRHRPLSAPPRRVMTPVRHTSDPNDIALAAARKPLDSALHEKRVAEALQLQRSRAAAADALKAKTKVHCNSAARVAQ